MSEPAIGRRVRRVEDRPLLTGRGRFAADIDNPGQLHMRIVRSNVARGRIRTIDGTAALKLPGVVAVWTGPDVAAVPPISFRMMRISGLEPFRQPVLAQGVVRYVGEPVAAVFADDPYVAEDAEELVAVNIEALPPYLDPTLPPPEFAPGLVAEAAVVRKEYGDLDGAFARAARVFEFAFAIARQTGTPIETRGALARIDAGGVLRFEGAAKVAHHNRGALAEMLELPLDRIHLHEGHVGGGFGIRGELYPEDVLVSLAALRLGRPVKWIEDRREHLIAANQSRGQRHRVRVACDELGFILGLDTEYWVEQGGYIRTHGVTVIDLTGAMLPGPYVIPAYRSVGHVRLTNKTPAGTYRAPGRFEGSFVRERVIEAIAAALGRDANDIRRVNFISKTQMPFTRGLDTLGTAIVYDSGDYAGLLDKTLARLRYPELKAAIAARRARGERVGIGFGFFVEKSGLGPYDKIRLELAADGTVEIVTGIASLGQGVDTVLAQIGADALDVPIEAIRVIHGQTDRIDEGRGAYASRVTVMTGSAVIVAAKAFTRKVCAAAAPLLQRDAAQLALIAGRVRITGDPAGPDIGLAEIARSQDGPIVVEDRFESSHMCYPYGLHVAVVRVDPETGGVALERFLVAYDVGRAINPTLVEGQIAGGAAQGIGGALYEALVWDEAGQPLAASFVDYLVPTALEVPPIETLVLEDAPSPINPLGAKGAGEGGISAAGAAIAAAVDDALGIPGAIKSLPIRPDDVRRHLRGR
jgi:CO/xanthine dehydrogenase Mo-binding subunit